MARPRKELPLVVEDTGKSEAGDRKIMALSVSRETHKYVRLFAATNDLTNEQVVEWCVRQARKTHPDFEMGLD